MACPALLQKPGYIMLIPVSEHQLPSALESQSLHGCLAVPLQIFRHHGHVRIHKLACLQDFYVMELVLRIHCSWSLGGPSPYIHRYTVDACFVSSQWHVRSKGGYAGTIIGVFFIVVVLEAFRRLAREYDRRLLTERKGNNFGSRDSINKQPSNEYVVRFRPTLKQQAIRSFFHFVQFSAGYLLMLMAMYYNGGVIFAIFIGSFVGFFLSDWDTIGEVTPLRDKSLIFSFVFTLIAIRLRPNRRIDAKNMISEDQADRDAPWPTLARQVPLAPGCRNSRLSPSIAVRRVSPHLVNGDYDNPSSHHTYP
ncbi:hypothetical protein EW146_g4653 [Bondarzewia mesenterica]|uniref:Copper transport protein n=1 Tax=Bondarzewia mesenterica TaxID=1095465 RepID=A0A4S4LUZ5_9AGAM|nr:hypothetical protein EW146_g4653 [Bondarzewia mesenterica]